MICLVNDCWQKWLVLAQLDAIVLSLAQFVNRIYKTSKVMMQAAPSTALSSGMKIQVGCLAGVYTQ